MTKLYELMKEGHVVSKRVGGSRLLRKDGGFRVLPAPAPKEHLTCGHEFVYLDPPWVIAPGQTSGPGVFIATAID